MKYAELPDGKLLKFPDGTSEKDMQRAVRKEMGLSHKDVLDEIEGLAKKVDGIQRQAEKVPARDDKPMLDTLKQLGKTLDGIASTLDLQGFQSAQLDKALKSIEGTSGSAARAIERGFDNLQRSIETHNKSMADLCKNMQGAIEHSTEAIQADLKASMQAVNTATSTAKKIEQWATMRKEEDAKSRGKRRAYRNVDGSWTLEDGNSKAH